MATITQFEYHLWVLLLALAVDVVAGGTNRFTHRLPHPVRAIGAIIGWFERTLNRDRAGLVSRRVSGLGAIVLLVGMAALAGAAATAVLAMLPSAFRLAFWIEGLVVAVFLAGRGLYEHVGAVAQGLEADDIGRARKAVGHIVGRDPQILDRAGIARAAIESGAENFSDAVLAPALWYVVLGLPGLLIYKTVNTADSMIGYRSARYRAFGACTARLDDALNYIPARLGAGLIAIGAWCAGQDGAGAFNAMRADAARHRSPNAGWPEAAMAGALGLALAGPRIYDGARIKDAWMNRTGRTDAAPDDIRRALRVYVFALLATGAASLTLALVLALVLALGPGPGLIFR